MTLNFQIPYSKCSVVGWVPIKDGKFEAEIPVMIDRRNYFAQIDFNQD